MPVLENVAFGDGLVSGAVVERVASGGGCTVIPLVVDGVDETVSIRLGAAAAGVLDVVALRGDKVGGAGEVDGPVVVVVVAGCAPGRVTVEFRRWRESRGSRHRFQRRTFVG